VSRVGIALRRALVLLPLLPPPAALALAVLLGAAARGCA